MKPFALILLLLGSIYPLFLQAGDASHDHAHNHQHESHDEAHNKKPQNHKSHNHTEEHHDEENHHTEENNRDAHDEEEGHEHDGHHHDDHQKSSSNDDKEQEGAHEHHDELTTNIEDNMAAKVGIETAQVSSQVLQQTIIVYGSLATGPEQLSHVRARYPGMIKWVKPTLGDKVKRGNLLAKVESNDSLNVYNIRAPISGTIIQRHANIGEVTQEQVLFSIANYDMLWAEFRIYPSQQSLVKSKQIAHIEVNNTELEGSIQHIIPAMDKPYQLARVSFDNRHQKLIPGTLVEGHIVVDEFTTTLAVEKDAIQTIGEQVGIFIKEGERYTFTPLTLGRRDARFVEVLSGISSKQSYVTKNSFLLKADIEKSEAEHVH